MLYELYKKINSWLAANQKDLFLAVLIVLTSVISFGLGRLSAIWPEKTPIRILNNEIGIMNEGRPVSAELNSTSSLESKTTISNLTGKYVASKNGTAYHYPWCPGALKIKEENKIWFDTKEEAEKRGYKPAGNCDGL